MDNNQLTPNKIKRLIQLAEDKSFNALRKPGHNDEDLKRLATVNQAAQVSRNKSIAYNCESSSGILDLDQMDAFGESDIGESLIKSAAFHPSEITGRSTGTEDVTPIPLGRHSLALESLTSEMDKQTFEIQDLMRHSIATNYSFYSKKDLTADEASLVVREAPLPVQNTTQTFFFDTVPMNTSTVSVGTYFMNRCSGFSRILTKTDSPDRSYVPSICEVSYNSSINQELLQAVKHSVPKMDPTLDCIPVRQPRHDNIAEKPSIHGKPFEVAPISLAKNKSNEAATSKTIQEPAEQIHFNPKDKADNIRKELKLTSPQKNVPVTADTDPNLLLKHLQSSLLKLRCEDTQASVENSFSTSKIADYLGKQSNVSVTEMIQYNNHLKQLKKQPLTELHTNIPENDNIQVTNLKETRKNEAERHTNSSSNRSTLTKDKERNHRDIPAVVVSRCSGKEHLDADTRSKRNTRSRSKSPSSRSQTTLSTVQENFASFKSGDSPLHTSRGEASTSRILSPNRIYKELDKSVDWREVMHQKHLQREGFAKEEWVEMNTTSADGYIGAACPVTLIIKTLTDSWLTATIQFDLPEDVKDLTIGLPTMPLLLIPRKTERITLFITSDVEMHTRLSFNISLKDTTLSETIEQKGEVEVNINLPIIQAMSADGVNKITFPQIHSSSSYIKSFVLISDCPADLRLELSIIENDIFTIKNVQEIKKCDINKVLLEIQAPLKDEQRCKSMINQICRLTVDNAIKVTIKFKSPQLSPEQIGESPIRFNGKLNVSLFGKKSVLRTVDLCGVVGTAKLVLNTSSKLQLSADPTSIEVYNSGSMSGVWTARFNSDNSSDYVPFEIAESKFELLPGAKKTINLSYTGPADTVSEATLFFEETSSGHISTIQVSGGSDKPKTFPVKTNFTIMSWVRPGRKDLSLKNVTNKKIYIRCQIIGDGFVIDLPRESRGIYSIPFGANECRTLPISFSPPSNLPMKATLHLVFDKNTDYSRKIPLYGCAGEECIRWFGLATYGDAALVRAISRAPIVMELHNKSTSAAFVYATVNFSLQYTWLGADARLQGAARVVARRARHSVVLRVSWARLERRARFVSAASTFATVTVLTGAESTRRRILKILRDESNGELDTSLLPDNLKVLAEPFEGEDDSIDDLIADFNETKASLKELIGGLQELTAQIDLPQDFADENTILISDDSTLDHHTLCD